MAWSLRTRVALLAGVLLVGAAPASTSQEPRARSERPSAGKPVPQDRGSDTPITDSIEPAVDRYVREHLSPCDRAGHDTPCFPVSIQVKGRQYSVKESLEDLELDDRPAPGPPTAADMIQHGANPHPVSAGVGIDPKSIGCKTKQLLRKIQGRSTTYYLYRVWDETGERAVLRDRPFDADAVASSPGFGYLPLGEFGDECEAIKAYLQSTHDVRLRREAAEAEPTPELEADDQPE